MDRPGSPNYRRALRADMIRFAAGAKHDFGFGYLDDVGKITAGRPIELYITCRSTHVFSLAVLAGEPPAQGGPGLRELTALAQHGVDTLLDGPLRDLEHGGWFSAVGIDGSPQPIKQAYAHAFVVLAATSAVTAGLDRSRELLDLALAAQDTWFWDEESGLVVEEWNVDWSQLNPYRGVNSNMHTVECYLAAGDVTGEHMWHARAGRIAERVMEWAGGNNWRIPEHFTAEWVPMLDHNRNEPAHPFQPFGATIGHGLEWARLLLAIDETLGDSAPAGLQDAALALAHRAIDDGWAVDGADGFVYTTDWDGQPVVRARMFWVLAEAIATSTVLGRTGNRDRHEQNLERWWAYAERHLVDHQHGSWHHELGPDNGPRAETWPGKPDCYHIYQAALIADVPTTPSFSAALAQKGQQRNS